MADIKIVVTKKNKEKIFKFLSELLDGDEETALSFEIGGEKAVPKPEVDLKMAEESKSYLRMPSEPTAIQFGEPIIAKSVTGTWWMFNSFIPGKAALRVLINMLQENNGKPVKFDSLVSKCSQLFKDAGFSKYRGFPSSEKDSSVGRLGWHLIAPLNDLGLIRMQKTGDMDYVTIIEAGFEFAKITNPLLDSDNPKPELSEEEKNWLKNYLKKIDAEGFKEFSLLSSFTSFIGDKERNREELVKWFIENRDFVKQVHEGTRYKDDPKKFEKQLRNLSSAYAGGKIALLRELGVVGEGRGNYKVVGRLEVDS